MPTGTNKDGTHNGFQKGHKGFRTKESYKTQKARPSGLKYNIKIKNKTWFKKGFAPWNKNKIYLAISEEKCHFWKGDNIGYVGLHMWVKKHLGKPAKCEHCGQNGLTGYKIHWANKNHKYKRNLKDWIRLCVKCHSKYDKKNRLTKNFK